MCLTVYVAAERPLEEVPWDDAAAGFHVEALAAAEAPSAPPLAGPHLYRAGAHEGCGCGFQLGEYPEYLEPEELPPMRAALDAFADWLEHQLARVPELEVHACWWGDEAAPPRHRRALTPDHLRADGFYFLEPERSRVARPDRGA